MVVGINIYKSKGTKGDVVAVVASMNETFSKFFSTARIFKDQNDLESSLSLSVKKAVARFSEANGGKKPGQIIVYRDGVQTGLMKNLETEGVNLQREIETVYEDNEKPTTGLMFSYIVVQKRTVTRLYTQSKKETLNPVAGTILDNTITLRDWFDFYLIPMNVMHGTVSPIHYVVVHDTTDMKPDFVQKLTFAMSHMYFNWPGHIKVPAVCQYSHKLAEMVGDHLHQIPKEELSDVLFYL